MLSVGEAFQQYCALDLDALIGDDYHHPPLQPIQQAALDLGLNASHHQSFEAVFFDLMHEKIEPFLGTPAPTLLINYPISMAALARAHPQAPHLSQRFECYVNGIELANGFGELTDAHIQRQRFIKDQAIMQQHYNITHPIDEDFLTALETMPPAAGIAFGVDRMIMLLGHAAHIKQTLWAYIED